MLTVDNPSRDGDAASSKYYCAKCNICVLKMLLEVARSYLIVQLPKKQFINENSFLNKYVISDNLWCCFACEAFANVDVTGECFAFFAFYILMFCYLIIFR